MKNRKLFFALSLGILFVLTYMVYFFHYAHTGTHVILGGKTFSVEVAETDMTREKGLSGHTPLSNSQGMLFVFDTPGQYGFWMKDMTFPLDIIWVAKKSDIIASSLDNTLKIVHIEKSLSPSTYPTVFYPSAMADYVLEINAGLSEILNLRVGDVVQIYKK